MELAPEDLVPANLLDLSSLTLIFTPDGQGGYSRTVQDLAWEEPLGDRVRDGEEIRLDFPFSSLGSGREWESFFVSLSSGLITFGAPHPFSGVEPWRFGTMQQIADVFVGPPTISVLYKKYIGGWVNPGYSWDMLIRASDPAFSCGRSPVSLEPLSIRLNRLENRTIEPVINRLPARGGVTRRQVDFPVRNSHRFGPFHGPDSSSVHYPGAQDTRASLFHNRFQSAAP